MDHRKLLEFQINRLGYRFKNVDLLQEALTHTVDLMSQFSSQNRRYDRLQVIGNPVIKFVVSQHVIQTCDVHASEGQLTKEKDQILNGTVQTRVGMKLLQSPSSGGGHYEFIRVGSASKLNFDKPKPGAQIPFKKFVRALMGAVYLDAGGILGDGIEMASKVFVRIWDASLLLKGNKTEGIQASFPPPSKDIQTFWEKNNMNAKFMELVEESIGVSPETRNSHLLAEALIQKTFYDTLPNYGISRNQYLPDYQRLEFLGDSVLGLVVAELVWLEEDPHYMTNGLDHKIRQRIESGRLLKIFNEFGLRNFVKMKAGGIPGWKNGDDIVESIVGAVFVDGGPPAAIQFIMSIFDDFKDAVDISQPSLQDLEAKLGYKFQNARFLIRALAHPSVLPNSAVIHSHSTKPSICMEDRSTLTYFGKAWIKFHASDYVLRSCCPEDTQATLESRREYLCSQSVLQRIGSNLQLSQYFRVTNGQMRSGTEPFMLYEDMVHTICGAIFKDMQEAKEKMAFAKVFYRLWNSFFENKIPARQLLDNFPQNCWNVLSDYEQLEIEEKVYYSFNQPWLVGEALTSSIFRRLSKATGTFVGDSVKFLFIGEAIIDLSLSVYITILWFMKLQGIPQQGSRSHSSPKAASLLHSLHDATLSDCMKRGHELFETEDLREHLLFPSNSDQRALHFVSNEEIIKCLLGAIYFDMSEECVDRSFSEWKDYFLNTCKFIQGKREE